MTSKAPPGPPSTASRCSPSPSVDTASTVNAATDDRPSTFVETSSVSVRLSSM